MNQRWVEIAGYALIVGVALFVLRPFLVPLAWAAILAYATWPLLLRMRRALGGRPGAAAALMTLAMILVVVIPSVLVSLALAAELQRTWGAFRAWLARGPAGLVEAARAIPLVGPDLAARIGELIADPAALQQWVLARAGGWVGAVTSAAGDAGRYAIEGALTVFALFFVYRDGGDLGADGARVIGRLGGPRMAAMLGPLGQTVRAVMYGTLFTALAQGLLVMLGCWVAGLRAPVLLGAVTVILALTPLGAPLVYVSASAWLALGAGRVLAGVLFLLWGLLIVSTADNVIRTWFLAGAVRVPFLLGLFGVLGGILAFGSIGLFIGPVAIALLLTLWRQWTAEDGAAA